MSENKQERGVIPAGTRVKLYEGRVTLLQDVVVDADQEWINKAIEDQEDFYRDIERVCTGGAISCPSPQLAQGAVSAMNVSENIGNRQSTHRRWEKYLKDDTDNQLNISMQNAVKNAAKALNMANNARFINIVEWRTNIIDRLLSHVSIKTIDDAIKECQKLEKHIFGEEEPDSPKDWRF